MAYSTPKTWVGGDPLNAANLNQHVRDQQSGLKDLLDDNAVADATAVARIDVIDAQRGDYTTVEQLDSSVSFNDGNAVLTSIQVPVCKTLLIAFRRDFLSGWLPDFSIPYTLFSLLTPVEAGDSLGDGFGFKLYARADDNEHDVWRVGWRDDGRMMVSVGNWDDSVRYFDQVCARFVIGL